MLSPSAAQPGNEEPVVCDVLHQYRIIVGATAGLAKPILHLL